MPRVSAAAARRIERACDLELRLGEPDGEVSHVQLDCEGIHTIRWDDKLTCDVKRLPRWLVEWDKVVLDSRLQRTMKGSLPSHGSCQLNQFPRIELATGESRLASPSELCVLVAILLDMTCMRLPEEGADGLKEDKERLPDYVKVVHVLEAIDMTGETVRCCECGVAKCKTKHFSPSQIKNS